MHNVHNRKILPERQTEPVSMPHVGNRLDSDQRVGSHLDSNRAAHHIAHHDYNHRKCAETAAHIPEPFRSRGCPTVRRHTTHASCSLRLDWAYGELPMPNQWVQNNQVLR